MQGNPGLSLPPPRPRRTGPLTPTEIHAARARGQPLAYCPAQHGLVLASARDADDDPVMPIWARLPGVQLRPWAAQDVAAAHAMLDDPGLWQFLPEPMPHPLSPDTVRALIEISGAAHHLVRCIDTPDGPAGQVRLLWQAPGLDPDEAELSYWLGRDHRGRGLALAAVRQMLHPIWDQRPGLRRVLAFVHPDNMASARLLARAGFHRAGTRDRDGWQAHALSRASAATHPRS